MLEKTTNRHISSFKYIKTLFKILFYSKIKYILVFSIFIRISILLYYIHNTIKIKIKSYKQK